MHHYFDLLEQSDIYVTRNISRLFNPPSCSSTLIQYILSHTLHFEICRLLLGFDLSLFVCKHRTHFQILVF